jgi:hypothetical protein
MSKSNTKVLPFNKVNVNDITCEAVKMGKDTVPLIKYNGDKLYFQGPAIKMKQYGFPAGKTLGNGIDNEYYQGEEGRNSFKFPLSEECAILNDSGESNVNELLNFKAFLESIDKHIKTNEKILEVAEIDPDHAALYNNIFKKWKPVKKGGKSAPVDESKKKFDSFKSKLDVEYSTNKIKTEFYVYNNDTSKYSLLEGSGAESVIELEKVVRYNSEVIPVFQLVKLWTQPTGAWGATLKLIKMRVKNFNNSKSSESVGFADEYEDEGTTSTSASAAVSVASASAASATSASASVAPAKKVAVAHVPSDDEDSDDDESDKPEPVQVKSKPKPKEVESDDDEADSDDEPKSKVVAKKPVAKGKARK